MLIILLLTSPIIIRTIGDGTGSENYVLCEQNADILSVVNSAGGIYEIYQFQLHSGPSDVTIDSSGNYIVTEAYDNILSKITPAGERTVIYTFAEESSPLTHITIDSSGNYIVTEDGANILSKITPTGERTVIYTFAGPYIHLSSVLISTAPELFFTDITENGLTATWTQSADPSFAGYQLYQSTARGQLGSLIGTNTDIADTSLAVTGLSPWTTYYFTVRVLGANGAYVNSAQRSMTTAKAFWQQDWFPYVVVVVAIVIIVAAVAIFLLRRSKKKAQVT